MFRRFKRFAVPVGLAVVCVLSLPAFSGAATKYDSSYQNGGTLLLPAIKGVYGQVASRCAVSGKRLHIAGRFGHNEPGLPTDWSTGHALALTSVKINPRQSMELGVARVRWTKQRIPTGHVVVASDFDPDGGFAYVTRSNRSATTRQELKLFRVDSSARRVKAFGKKGYITVTVAGLTQSTPYGLRVIALAKGKVLLIAQTKTAQILLRYTKSGKPDSTWGSGGAVELPAPKELPYLPVNEVDSATVTSGGGLLISASGTPTNPQPDKLGLLKLSASGNVVSDWADNGFWTPPPPKPGSTYSAAGWSLLTTVRKGGDFAAIYADSKSQEIGTLFDLKLAYVDEETGVTTATTENVGSFYNGGDDGFPGAEPWSLGLSSTGPIFAMVRSFYESPGGSFFGKASRFSPSSGKIATTRAISNSGFATGAFATDPTSKNLYFCGSFGTTSKKAKKRAMREQRKNVAIRRVTL